MVPMRLSGGGGAPSATDDGAVLKRVTVTCTVANATGTVSPGNGPTSIDRPLVGAPPLVSVLPEAEQIAPWSAAAGDCTVKVALNSARWMVGRPSLGGIGGKMKLLEGRLTLN